VRMHAIADRGGTELLALQQDFQNRAFALPGQLGRAGGEFWIACFLPLTFSAGIIAVAGRDR